MRDLCRPPVLLDAVAARALRQFVGFVVAVVAAACVYIAGAWSAYHAQARVNGTLAEGSLAGEVTIARDVRGVPHITAATQDDAFFAQGFAQGSDRLFQMELTRRYALGTLAEVFGPRALSLDQSQRNYDVRDIVARQWRELGERDRAALTAFSAGVNAAIAQQPLPAEFALLVFRPRAWTPQDSLAVSMAVSLALADSWRDVLTRNDVWQRHGRAGFERAYPLSDASYDVTLEGGSAGRGGGVDVARVLQPRAVGRRRIGSNAWAAAGSLTASGRALLANDPHLDLTIPGLWYLVDLRAPGLHVAGASIPGAPGVLLGHNERIAWGATNADAVAMSVFAAPVLPRGCWRRERFAVRFSGEVTRSYCRTQREFAVADTADAPGASDARADVLVRWEPFWRGASPIATFLALDRAGTISQAMHVLAGYRGTPENFVVAGEGGRVAYHLAGSIPRDPAWGRYVHPARELRETFAPIPFALLPGVAAGRSRLLITANNKMYRDGYPYRLSATFEPPYRAYRIAALLRERRRYDAAWFARMQLDTVSPIDAEFARIVTSRAKASGDDESTGPALRALRGWNGSFAADSRAATIEHAVRARLEVDTGSSAELLDALRAHAGGANVEADLRDALAVASDTPQPWGIAAAIRVEHPLAPLRFGFLNGATLPGDGDEYTIHLQEPGFSQSFRAVWEVGNWNAGGIVIPSGESGEPGSAHYDDLSAAWIAGRMIQLPFGDDAVRQATRQRLVLVRGR